MYKPATFALLCSFCLQNSLAQNKSITGFSTQNATKQFQTEATFDKNLDAKRIGNFIREFSAKPHELGSPNGKEIAEKLQKRWQAYGLDTKIETYTVLFPVPKTRVLEMTGPTKYEAILKEPALKEDATSGQQDQLPIYNAWSADGDVTGELVFVNFGMPQDYEELEKQGISVKGKIVIARYGRSWRGIKPKVAQEHGAVGCIIYSDPAQDGYLKGSTYPTGRFMPSDGVQRGAVSLMSWVVGDVLTPGWASTPSQKD
ncbi:MAG: folate hydrolase, partial [Mucilaginibacter polytrichastri]|nr:folate hydrolase [Mucilaginibacter polytrichastri]